MPKGIFYAKKAEFRIPNGIFSKNNVIFRTEPSPLFWKKYFRKKCAHGTVIHSVIHHDKFRNFVIFIF
jgi:hypothetical protein